MEKPDISAIAQKMIEAVRGLVVRSEASISGRLDGLEARLNAIPPAERGEKGDQGPPGESIKGDRGDAGKDGRDGKDGESVRPDTVALMVRDAADKVAAAMPKPKDGRDGFSLEDFQMLLSEDGRTLSLAFVRGEVKVERQVTLATMIYREVWREGEYDRGDTVTWDGSIFVALRKTEDKPGNSTDWRLAVKRGRDGKDGAAPVAAARELVRLR